MPVYECPGCHRHHTQVIELPDQFLPCGQCNEWCQCGNCDWEGPAADLDAANNLMERLEPNPWTLLPAGDCPECGCLAYGMQDAAEYQERQNKLCLYDDLLNALRTLLRAIMDEHGGGDLLPVNEAFDPVHYKLVQSASAVIAECEAAASKETSHVQ